MHARANQRAALGHHGPSPEGAIGCSGAGRKDDLLASLRSCLSVGHSLPGLNLRRSLPRLDDVIMGPSLCCGRRLGVHLANEV